MRILVFISFLFWISSSAFGQEDSSKVLTYAEFIQRIKEHHPLAKQAELQRSMGDAYVTKARGNFDPKLHGNANQKYYKDQQYYSIINAGLKIPTWYGVSFQTGYDLNTGTQLNPERYLPDDGLWYAGVNIALAKGLVIDERRAEYKKAKIYRDATVQNQRIMMNDLLLESSYAYWNWFKAYNKFKVYERAVENAKVRFESVRESAFLGDKSFMDTLESNLQLQSRTYNFMQAELEFLNASELLSIYLWENGYIPLELDSLTHPPVVENVELSYVEAETILQIDSLKANHPEILKTQYSVAQKKVDLNLSRNNLLPDFNLKYNAIATPDGGTPMDNYSLYNYTWGADLTYPLFIRKERGQLKLDRLELESMEAGLAFKTEQVSFKIESSYNQWVTTSNQIELWQRTTSDFYRLLQNEQTLFNTGESSLFMINSREKNYINAQIQLVETMMSHQMAAIKTKHAMGILF